MIKEELLVYIDGKYELYIVSYDKEVLDKWIYKIIDKHKKVIEFDENNIKEILDNMDKFDNGKIQGIELTDNGFNINLGEVYEYPNFIRSFYVNENKKFKNINIELKNFSTILQTLADYDTKDDFLSKRLTNKYMKEYFDLCSFNLESNNILFLNELDKKLAKNNSNNIKKLEKVCRNHII